jgi:ABC-type Na+ efflux pump permease subunit
MGESILWELTRLRRHMGGTAGVTLYVLGTLVLGVAAPLYFGFAFASARVLFLYTLLPVLLAPPVVAESVGGERELTPESPAQRREWLYGKVGAGIIYGWISVGLIFALAGTSLRLSEGRFLLVPMQFVVGLLLVSLASSFLASSLAAAVAIGARSPKAAKRAMRQGLLLLVIVLLYLSRQPWAWTRRLAVPETAPRFLEFTLVMCVAFVGLALGLIKLALHAAEPAEIRLNL